MGGVFAFKKSPFLTAMIDFWSKNVTIWAEIIKKERLFGRNAQKVRKCEENARYGLFLIVTLQYLVTSIKKTVLGHRFLLFSLCKALDFWQICELTKKKKNCNIL